MEKDAGAVYFSVELFHSLPGSTEYFLVQDVPMAMDILGKRFLFDLGEIPPEETLRSAPVGDAVSIVQCYVLRPKGRNNECPAKS